MKITVSLLRDLVMLGLGSAGMTHELFLVGAPNMIRVSVSIGMLLGPAALNSWWRLRNPTEPVPVTPTPAGPPPSPSSSSSPGS